MRLLVRPLVDVACIEQAPSQGLLGKVGADGTRHAPLQQQLLVALPVLKVNEATLPVAHRLPEDTGRRERREVAAFPFDLGRLLLLRFAQQLLQMPGEIAGGEGLLQEHGNACGLEVARDALPAINAAHRDDGNIAGPIDGTQLLHDSEPVDLRQQKIQQHEIWRLILYRLQRGRPVVDGADRVAQLLDRTPERATQRAVVFCDQNFHAWRASGRAWDLSALSVRGRRSVSL